MQLILLLYSLGFDNYLSVPCKLYMLHLVQEKPNLSSYFSIRLIENLEILKISARIDNVFTFSKP